MLLCSRFFLLLLLGGSAVSSSEASSFASSDSCFQNNDEHPDFIPHLPGYNQPLPSAWFSGYLTYELEGRTIHTHYVLIQAEEDYEDADEEDEEDDVDDESNNNNSKSKNKPVIYWSNGGPGASSLFGLLTELGPLLLDDRSLLTEEYRTTGIPTPVYNPNAWTRLGHLLLIDQPAPVGFSYCEPYNVTSTSSTSSSSSTDEDDDDDDNADDDPTSCGGLSWTDERAAANTLRALEVFYTDTFPCLTDTDLYLTGESYAGIYIPTLARSILKEHGGGGSESESESESGDDDDDDDAAAPDANFGKLQGIAVGDGCLGTETDICRGVGGDGSFFDLWAVLFMAGHGQIPLDTFQKVLRACRVGHRQIDSDSMDGMEDALSSSATGEVCQAALKEVDKEVGGFYGYSLYDDCTYRNGLGSVSGSLSGSGASITGALNDYACGGGLVMDQYISLDVVKDAFHVESEFFAVDNAEGFDYTATEKDLTGFYKSINGKLRVLVYNGDTDPAITSFAAQNWTSHLDFIETEAWRPWTVDGCRRMGGYVTRYEGDFDFLTIRGAGHMVPAYKPKATFTFLKAWLEGTDYPVYDEKCEFPGAAAATATAHHAEEVALPQ